MITWMVTRLLDPFMEGWAYVNAASGFLLVNWILQATLLLGVGLLVVRLRRLAPGVRHGLLVSCLLLAALPPAIRLFRAAPVRPLPTAAPAALRPLPTRTGVMKATPLRTASVSGPAPRSQGAPLLLVNLPGLLMGLCLLVGTVRLLQVALGVWQVRSWRKGASPVPLFTVGAAVGYKAAELRVLESGDVRVPCAVGVRRPSVLLPQGLADSLPARELGLVLLHEEAHLRRQDPLAFLLAECAAALLWWHPLALPVRRAIEAAAEDACDLRVLSQTTDAPAYARTLMAVLEHAGGSRGLACRLGMGGQELRRRVMRILGEGPRHSLGTLGLAGLLVGGVFGGAAFLEVGDRPAPPQWISTPAGRGAILTEPLASASVPDQSASKPTPVTLLPSRRPQRAAERRNASHELPFGRPIRSHQDPSGLPGWAQSESGAQTAELAALEPPSGRTVVYLLDVSANMKPYRTQSVDAILTDLERLGPDDRFSLIAFSTGTRPFSEEPTIATPEIRAYAAAWLHRLPDACGANLGQALTQAFAVPEVTCVKLFSDGLPSEGARSEFELEMLVARENCQGARIFVTSPYFDQVQAAAREGEALLTALARTPGGEARAIHAPSPIANEGVPSEFPAPAETPRRKPVAPITAGQKTGIEAP